MPTRIRYQRWARQPAAAVLTGANTLLSWSAASSPARADLAARSSTPFGIAASSNLDNALQLGRYPTIQNADLATLYAVLYCPSAPSGSFSTRIGGTRGAIEGAGGRRGWEVSLDGGSVVEAQVQFFDSSGNRAGISNLGLAYAGTDVVGQQLLFVFQTSRSGGSSFGSAWLKPQNGVETSNSGSIAGEYGNDTGFNFVELCGEFSGNATNADYQVIAAGFDIRPATDARRNAFYRDPFAFLFAPRQIRVPAAAGGPSLPTLSASTFKPGTLTATGWTPRVTAS